MQLSSLRPPVGSAPVETRQTGPDDSRGTTTEHFVLRSCAGHVVTRNLGQRWGTDMGIEAANVVSSRRRRDASLRNWSVKRREATVTSQPSGRSGRPSRGHRSVAAIIASWTASSQASKWPYRRTSAPRACGVNRRSRSSMPSSVRTASLCGPFATVAGGLVDTARLGTSRPFTSRARPRASSVRFRSRRSATPD